jgi:peptide/nickel transport system permease protein
MAIESQAVPTPLPSIRKKPTANSTFLRVVRYTGMRIVTLFFTMVVGIFLTILIANMGGYVDQILRGQVEETVSVAILNNPAYRNLPSETKNKLVQDRIALETKRLGLDKPVIVRDLSFLVHAITLDLGRAQNMNSDTGSRQVSRIILERMPPTLLLMGTSNLFLFFSSVFLALVLSRNYGSIWDKLVVALSPTSAIPPWFFGIFLIVIFSASLKILPFSGMISSPPPETPFDYVLSVTKHLILPASSIVLSAIIISIYQWRTFFLIYSGEDYVEMAKAKGLNARSIERRYILRPTMPAIVTNFSLLIISLMNGAIITETIFLWPGLGRTTFRAIGFYDVPVIVGITVIYAYLLAITVFLLDIVYAVIDPRVKIGGGEVKQ